MGTEMPHESNYFEEAYRLCGDPDPFVAGMAKSLYQQMASRHATDGLSPKGGFNILYFFQSAIRLMERSRPDMAIGATHYPYPCKPIHAVNYPAELNNNDPHRELWKTYLQLVRADSKSLGDDFDVGYALAILSSAIGRNGKFEPCQADTIDDNPDKWLAAFNSEQS
jgi:hypothetical protein